MNKRDTNNGNNNEGGTMNGISVLIDAASARTTAELIAGIKKIGGGDVDEPTRMVRAAMIEVIANRDGVGAADAIMDEIGL